MLSFFNPLFFGAEGALQPLPDRNPRQRLFLMPLLPWRGLVWLPLRVHQRGLYRRTDRWRAELEFPPGVLPTAADFHAAANVGNWQRAELVARIVLQDGHRLSAAARRLARAP